MRMNKEAVDEKDKKMDTVLKFLKREFIRRGQPYDLDTVLVNQIQSIIQIPKGVLWSIISRINEKYVDVQIMETIDENTSKKKKIIDFIPITERYQKNKKAEKKADKYMRNSLINTMSNDKRKTIKLYKGKKSTLSSSNQSDNFMQALGVQYGRKQKSTAQIKEKWATEQLVIDTQIDSSTKELVLTMIREEYIKRISQKWDYKDFRFKISEISADIERATKISAGRLWPLLNEIAVEDWNFNLNANFEGIDKNKYDRLIEFLPIDDYDIYYALQKYRPNDLKEIHLLMQTWFDRNIHYKRRSLNRLSPLKYKDDDAEFQRSYRSKWFAIVMRNFAKTYIDRQRHSTYKMRQSKSLWKAADLIIKGKLADIEKKNIEKTKKNK